MPQPALLPDLLRTRALREPDRTAYTLLDERGQRTAALTYADLHARALAVAGLLAEHCGPGERALLLFGQSLDFVVAYFGCLYAQVVAVPVSPPRRERAGDATVRIARDCRPAVVLTDAVLEQAARASLAPHCGPARWLRVDQVDTAAAPGDLFAADPLPREPGDIAFLQYTSGSTSDPKGVMVSHGNLVANLETIRRSFGHDQESTFVGWTPLFHDQGLIGNILQPLYVGTSCVLMSPSAFIRRPLLWLSAISRYRAHTSGGPNFAYDACVARAARGGVEDLGLDLSCWKVAFNGAEPVRADTLRAFTEAFAPFGFDERAFFPCYGLAEATLFVSGSGKGRGPRLATADTDALRAGRYQPAPAGRGSPLVGSGVVPPEVTVRIVDPETGRPCQPDEVGEIWVAGDQVATGYWELPVASAATFRARCADDPGGTYLRTGDLGVLVDGELFVVGRLKDMVIIRGRNYYPHDIERTVSSAHPALRDGRCAAFSVPDAGMERLIVVQEIRAEHSETADPAEVAACVRAAVIGEHQISVGDLVLTVPGQLQKTTSGKMMRTAARTRYLAAAFHAWPKPAAG